MITVIKNIPCWHKIDTSKISVKENDDALINIESLNSRIMFEPYYFMRGIQGAQSCCYMRESVFQLLVKALGLLPDGYGFKIYDAWRPFDVQKFLYDEQVNLLCEVNKFSLENAKEEAKRFVSYPSTDPLNPYVHSTGGAVDLTIVDENNNEIDMGTRFDDFSSLAATDSFEKSQNTLVRNNRRLLYSIMTEVGFTNYPSEWWHYDYGDAFWASENKLRSSLFGGIYKI